MKKLITTLLISAAISPITYANSVTHPAKLPIIAQYFGIWTEKGQTWEQKFRSDTPFDKLNRLYVAFARIVKTDQGHFTLEFDGDENHAKDIITRMHAVNPTAEVLLSVGGYGGGDSFGGAAYDTQFADNVYHFLTKYGFNGVDIDWEMDLYHDKINSLLTNLANTLRPHGMKLTMDVWPYVRYADYDLKTMSQTLDEINIMSYGARFSLDYAAASYIHAGFPAEKIIGGVETEFTYPGEVDTLTDTGSIVEKATFAKENGLAGMMGWRLDNDYADESPQWPTYKGAITLWEAMKN